MTIDEAIVKNKEKAECFKKGIGATYAQEYEQLAEWLEELKAYRTLDKTNFSDGYNKAIDDFADRLSEYLNVKNATKYGNKNEKQLRNSYDTLMKYEIADGIDDVAEQLKAGEHNG